MSSDALSPESSSRRIRTADRRFRRTLAITVSVLVVAVGGLTAFNAVKGPRVVRGEINQTAAIERTDQRLVLHIDQPITELDTDAVRVEPAVPVEVVSEGATVTVRFAEALKYATEYRVSIAEARGTATGASGPLEWSFTTPDPSIYALQRDTDPAVPDRIVQRDLGGTEATTLFEGDRIQDYAAAGRTIAVVTLDADNVATLSLAATDGSGVGEVQLPADGSVTDLHATGSTGLVGFVFTSRPGADEEFGRILYTYDTTDPSGVARPVLGVDGAPLSVLDWTFVPGTTSLIAQDPEESLYLINPISEDPPAPLGAHSEMRGFIAGTTRLVVADPQQGATIDLSTGETAPLDLPDADLPEGAVPGPLVVLGGDSYLELVSTFDDPATGAGLASRIIRVDGDQTREIWSPAAEGTRVGDICLSPNGQYLAVETISAEGMPDGYPDVPGSSATSTVFVDIETGDAGRGIAGFRVDWCG